MRDHHRLGRGFPRLVLLLAGLLYLAGTAAEPLVHPFRAPLDGDVVWAGGEGAGHPDSSRSHGDAQCLLCKIAGPVLVPERGPAVAAPPVPATAPFVLVSPARAPPTHLAPRPRAPPSI